MKKEIKDYEKESNYGYIECPCCVSDKLISYGRYERNVIVVNVNTKMYKKGNLSMYKKGNEKCTYLFCVLV